MNPTLVILIFIISLALFAVFAGVLLFFLQKYFNPEPTAIKQRLMNLKGEKKLEDRKSNVKKEKQAQLLYKDRGYQNESLNNRLVTFPFYSALKLKLEQLNISTPVDSLYIKLFIAPIIVSIFLGVISRFYILACTGFIVPIVYLFFLQLKLQGQLNKFITMLPDTLNMMTSTLKAGHSLSSALQVISTEMGPPISSEFTIMVRDLNLGIPVKETFLRLNSRLNSLSDVKMMSTAIIVQREAGGNLAEIMDNLANTIRERFKLKGQIASLTGQARATGYVLGGAPMFTLFFLSLFMYQYVSPLYETLLGNVLLGVCFILQLIGFIIMKKIVDIRV